MPNGNYNVTVSVGDGNVGAAVENIPSILRGKTPSTTLYLKVRRVITVVF